MPPDIVGDGADVYSAVVADASSKAAAKEMQLSAARRERKETDNAHQAMLNRISLLRSAETKLDRDIEAAKRRALELLSRKAERAHKAADDDVANAIQDVLGAMAGTASAGGRAAGTRTSGARLAPVAARSSLKAPGSTPLPPRTPVEGAPCEAGRKKLKPASCATSAGMQRTASTSAPSSASGTRPQAAAAPAAPALPKSKSANAGSNMAVLERGTGGGPQRGSSAEGSKPAKPDASLNTMAVLDGGPRRAGEADEELIEELIASASGGGLAHEAQMCGLTQFSTQPAASSKLQMRTAVRRQESGNGAGAGVSSAVLASAVGWGCGAPSGIAPGVLVADPMEVKKLKSELDKKRQLRSMRKAFGLEAVKLTDGSASVQECGAGAWQ